MTEAVSLQRLGASAVLAAAAGLLMAWSGWWLRDGPPADAYAQDSVLFVSAAETYAQAHAVGERDGMPLVQPPPGADVPVVARRFQFWPALQLQAGKTYHLHVAAVDTVHSVVVQGRELALLPGQVRVVDVTPQPGAPPILQCGEYCGLGHNRMGAAIIVMEAAP